MTNSFDRPGGAPVGLTSKEFRRLNAEMEHRADCGGMARLTWDRDLVHARPNARIRRSRHKPQLTHVSTTLPSLSRCMMMLTNVKVLPVAGNLPMGPVWVPVIVDT